MKAKTTKPPADLTIAAKRLWRQVQEDYGITDAAGLVYLSSACQAFDRAKTAREIIKRDGLTIKNRYGQQRPNPLLTVERAAAAQMAEFFKCLNLDLQPLRPGPGRPPGR